MNQLVPLVLFHRALPWKLCSIGTCAFSYKGQESEGKGKGKGEGGRAKENRQDNSKLSYKNCFDTPR